MADDRERTSMRVSLGGRHRALRDCDLGHRRDHRAVGAGIQLMRAARSEELADLREVIHDHRSFQWKFPVVVRQNLWCDRSTGSPQPVR